jgi:hypothetical protein
VWGRFLRKWHEYVVLLVSNPFSLIWGMKIGCKFIPYTFWQDWEDCLIPTIVILIGMVFSGFIAQLACVIRRR